MDVLDIDWSPRGPLASASIDNTVLIWADIPATRRTTLGSRVLQPSRVLRDHTCFVKGLSFDPFGAFLASSAANNTIIVWSCEAWTPACTLTDVMEEAVDRTMFRRISWAPDGGSLCVTAGSKNGKPVGVVLKRNTWESIADLVGHSAQSTCCRFNPQAMVRGGGGNPPSRDAQTQDGLQSTPKKKKDKKRVACSVALGDQSGVVSVWTTGQTTPLFVLDDVFDGPVLDMSWVPFDEGSRVSPGGGRSWIEEKHISRNMEQLLACCSLDGTVVLVAIAGQGVTGGSRVMRPEELEEHLRSLYGRSTLEMIRTPEALPEGPMVLQYKHKRTNGSGLQAPPGGGANVSHFTQSLSEVADTTAQNRREAPTTGSLMPTATMTANVRVSSKGGKKRIQPMLLAHDSGTHHLHSSSSLATSSAPVGGESVAAVSSPAVGAGHASAGKDSSHTAPHGEGSGTIHMAMGAKRPRLLPPSSSGNASHAHHPAATSYTYQQDATICRTHAPAGDRGLSVAVIHTSSAHSSRARGLAGLLNGPASADLIVHSELLPRPREFSALKHFGLQLTSLSLRDSSMSSAGDGKVHSSAGILWECHVSGVVTALCALRVGNTGCSVNCGVCVVGTGDGMLQLFSLASGTRVSPSLVLGTSIAFVDAVEMKSHGDVKILSVTADGDVYVYHLTSPSTVCATATGACTSSSANYDNDTSSRNSECGLSLLFKSSLRPILMSMQQQRRQLHVNDSVIHTDNSGAGDESNVTAVVWVERCFLAHDSGDVVALLHCEGAEGGSWQCFQYSMHMQSWLRLVDMRGFLCG